MLSGKQVFWFLVPIVIAFIISYYFEKKFDAKYSAKLLGNSGSQSANQEEEVISVEDAREITKRQLQ